MRRYIFPQPEIRDSIFFLANTLSRLKFLSGFFSSLYPLYWSFSCVFTTHSMLRIMKFLLHWFKDSFEKAGNSKFELRSNLQCCSMVRLSYLKKWSGIMLYSHQNYDFRKRNPKVYILRRKVQVKFSAVSSTFRALHLWFWTVGEQLSRISRIISWFIANILAELHALKYVLQTE